MITDIRNAVGGNVFGYYFVIGLCIAAVIFALRIAVVGSRGTSLKRKFVSMGTIAGKPFTDIKAVVGAPNSIVALPGGVKVRAWVAPNYAVSLKFDASDLCVGVLSETGV